MRPSSSRPLAASTAPAAHTPATKAPPDPKATAAAAQGAGRSENNTKMQTAKAAPGVPGARGTSPVPAALATEKASRADSGREDGARRWLGSSGSGPEERGHAPRPGGGPTIGGKVPRGGKRRTCIGRRAAKMLETGTESRFPGGQGATGQRG